MAINMRTYGSRDIVLDPTPITAPPPGGGGGAAAAGVLRGVLAGPSSFNSRPGVGGGNQRGASRSDVSIQVDVTGSSKSGGNIGGGNGSSNSGSGGGGGGGYWDRMGRSGSKKSLGAGGGNRGAVSEIPLYSREDIREQYCINSRKEPLDSGRRSKGFFGCLTSRKDKSKSKKRSSFFALCVRRSSEDNLYNGYNNKPIVNAGPRSITMPALKPFTVPLREDGPGSFRNRPQSFCTSDPRRFSVQPVSGITTPCLVNAPRHHSSDHEFKFNTLPLHRSSEVEPTSGSGAVGSSGGGAPRYQYGGRLAYTQPNTPEMSVGLSYRRQVMSTEALSSRDLVDADRRSTGSSKHVSFDASSPSSEIYTSAVPANASKSQERLLGSKTPEAVNQDNVRRQQGAAFSPVLARAILLERLRQASMRSQATQTEGFYNSTTSLSYPLSISADSQLSIPSALSRTTSTVNRHVQTRSESSKSKIRLSKSFSSVNRNEDEKDDDDEDDEEADGRQSVDREVQRTVTMKPLSRRPEELSQSQPEKIGGTDSEETVSPALVSSNDDGQPRYRSAQQRRRHKMLKALSEGTIILMDRRKARSLVSGYVEVQTDRMEGEEVEEPPAGRILVHDPSDTLADSSLSSCSSGDEDLARCMATSTSMPLLDAGETNRSKNFGSEVDDEVHGWSDQSADHPPPRPDRTTSASSAFSLPNTQQKSFDSNASLPDTPAYDSDAELGSTSLVTVIRPHPLVAQPSGTSGSSSFVVSVDEPMDQHEQHPPILPSRRLLPAPLTLGPTDPSETEIGKEIMVQFPPWVPSPSHSPHGSELIPAPPNFASHLTVLPPPLPTPPPLDPDEEVGEIGAIPAPIHMGLTERVLLRHLKSKSLSETITSVDSDSSGGCRQTEHETSISSPEIPDVGDIGCDPGEINSPNEEDAAAAPAASSGDTSEALFLTAVSDQLTTTATSRDHFSTAMDQRSLRAESDTGSYNSTLRTDHPAQELPFESPPPEVQVPLATSPESVDGAVGGRASSTSGSYSLDAPVSPPPASPPEEFSSLHMKPSSPSPPAPPTEVDSAVRVLKEAMKLQFPPGATMFSSNETLTTPQGGRPTGGRRKHQQSTASLAARNLGGNLSSSDSDDDPSSSSRIKWRSSKSSEPSAGSNRHKKSSSSSSRSHSRDFISSTTPSTKTPSVDVMTPGMVRSPAMHEGFRIDDWVSRTPRTPSNQNPPPPLPPPPPPPPPQQTESTSSVFSSVIQRPSESGSSPNQLDNQAASVVGAQQHRLAPSPSPHHCDSARSVSPGSDNVFVSESTEMLLMSGGSGTVNPPEGFADSPVTREPISLVSTGIDESESCGIKRKPDSGRGKRAKSCTLPTGTAGGSNLDLQGDDGDASQPVRAVSTIDVWYPETQLPPKRQLTVRAKSEERERWNRPARRNLERFAQSMAGCSWDSLGTKLSCDGTPLDDEDAGIYNASYRAAAWAYIGETEELQVWQRQPRSSATPTTEDPLQEPDDSSTASEKDFRRKYTSITHRMVHRKSSIEMFRRLATSTFECDDIVLVKRESGEFGFRIHGSRPVVVSAIEPATPAEISGLQVGDIIISINDVNVLESSHSEVVRIAHAGSDELKLEVARTCHVLTAGAAAVATGTAAALQQQQQQQLSSDVGGNEAPILVGYLWKKSQSASRADETNPVWFRRWFILKRDNCLYYYKNQDSSQPLGAVSLLHHTVTRSSFADRPYGLLLSKGGTIRHWLAAENAQSVDLWLSVFHHASKSATQEDVWLDLCTQNIQLPPGQMAAPDCVGHLMKLGHRAKEWQRRFCLLKDACLYFYVDINVSSALGALHLHGYRVQGSGTSASSGERRKFAFELLPPEPRMRHFHFYTDSENDRKRWIAALEYSIDRWIRVG